MRLPTYDLPLECHPCLTHGCPLSRPKGAKNGVVEAIIQTGIPIGSLWLLPTRGVQCSSSVRLGASLTSLVFSRFFLLLTDQVPIPVSASPVSRGWPLCFGYVQRVPIYLSLLTWIARSGVEGLYLLWARWARPADGCWQFSTFRVSPAPPTSKPSLSYKLPFWIFETFSDFNFSLLLTLIGVWHALVLVVSIAVFWNSKHRYF